MTDTHDKVGLRLPRGITGFYDWRDNPPPTVAPGTFKAACYHAARVARATVTRCVASGDQNIRNYHAAKLRLEAGQTVSVIGNAHYPLLAFEDQAQSQDGAWYFVDMLTLATAFRATTWTPLAAEWLGKQPTPDMLHDLSEAEHRQIRAWKPRQIGDIVFNVWD